MGNLIVIGMLLGLGLFLSKLFLHATVDLARALLFLVLKVKNRGIIIELIRATLISFTTNIKRSI